MHTHVHVVCGFYPRFCFRWWIKSGENSSCNSTLWTLPVVCQHSALLIVWDLFPAMLGGRPISLLHFQDQKNVNGQRKRNECLLAHYTWRQCTCMCTPHCAHILYHIVRWIRVVRNFAQMTLGKFFGEVVLFFLISRSLPSSTWHRVWHLRICEDNDDFWKEDIWRAGKFCAIFGHQVAVAFVDRDAYLLGTHEKLFHNWYFKNPTFLIASRTSAFHLASSVHTERKKWKLSRRRFLPSKRRLSSSSNTDCRLSVMANLHPTTVYGG